ncbi:hypothetical protein LEP1GSC019_4156 [Leptospira interrogans serovar Pyrogenes str. 2006006960]|uniref:Uncharacterized protein n=1 Tax=Leptospira interrogans str. UI 12621 TaxID=1049937 RepID=A0A0F6H3S7_LEPIR|nr:hypothetical protein LEP1GSC104_1525 [Leptospira interrogans str. UI 12621]EKR18291.1 hypothetical protein LEP1GSC019_4156 [Leptospira interrogans serovar Pyrogenes str. 2006006960]
MVVPTILELVRKIVIYSSSHIVLQTNLNFIVVPTEIVYLF